jgi:hypothetical protein
VGELPLRKKGRHDRQDVLLYDRFGRSLEYTPRKSDLS